MPLPRLRSGQHHLPIYWRWWRRGVLPGVATVALWALSDHAFEWFGLPEPDWLWLLMLGVNGVGLLLMYALIWVHPQRAIGRALRAAPDISHICTRCLYISDRLPKGEPCPECGRPHPDRLVQRWRATATSLSLRRRIDKALATSALTAPPTTASAAGTDRPD
ncbi:MAG: hypothetical protein ACTS22_07710 [Phycisphaerales bacterium]